MCAWRAYHRPKLAAQHSPLVLCVLPLAFGTLGIHRYGHHFEKKAILDWINEGNNFCPVTGNPLRPSNLISDPTLQWKIQYWAKKNAGRDLAAERKERGEQADGNVLSLTGFVAVPDKRFFCPLTKDLMEDPVMSKTGHNFERKCIPHLPSNRNNSTVEIPRGPRLNFGFQTESVSFFVPACFFCAKVPFPVTLPLFSSVNTVRSVLPDHRNFVSPRPFYVP